MIANIIIDIKASELKFNYTYKIPEEIKDLKVGDRVIVPFGNTHRLGFVYEISYLGDKKFPFELLPITIKIDNEPFLSKEFISLFKALLDKTSVSPNYLLLNIIPKILYVDYYKEVTLLDYEKLPLDLREDFKSGKKTRLPKKDLSKVRRYQDLANKGIVEFNSIYKDRLNYDTETFYEMVEPREFLFLSEKQSDAFTKLKKLGKISSHELKNYDLTKKEIDELIKLGLAYELVEVNKNVKTKLNEALIVKDDLIKNAFNKEERFLISTSDFDEKVKVVKNFYRENANNQTIFLITSNANLADRYYEELKDLAGVYLYHSYLSKKELSKSLANTLRGNARIVIGTRDALFLTAENTSLIIASLDGYNETTFTDLHIDIYDIIYEKAKITDASIVYLGNVPSISFYYYLKKENIEILKDNIISPKIISRKEEIKLGSQTFLGVTFENEIKKAIAEKHPVIVINARKGESLFVQCKGCYFVLACSKCGHSLRYYKSKDKLVCPNCLNEEKMPDNCPSCNSDMLSHIGFGVEKTMDELKELLPNNKKIYLESPTYKDSKNYIKKLNNGDIELLLTTKGILKADGLRKDTRVFVLNIDLDLKFPLYNSDEIIYQNVRDMQQKLDNPIYILTSEPNDTTILNLGSNYKDFYNEIIKKREIAELPPIYDNYHVIIKGNIGFLKTYQEAFTITEKLKGAGYKVLGPINADIYDMEGYNFKITIKGPKLDPKKIKEIIEKNKVKTIDYLLYLTPIIN